MTYRLYFHVTIRVCLLFHTSLEVRFSFAANLIVSFFFPFFVSHPHHTDNTVEAFIANRHDLCRYSTALIAKVLLVLEHTLVSDTKRTDANRNEIVVVVTPSPNYCSALILWKSMSCSFIFAVLYLQNKEKMNLFIRICFFFELQNV